MIRSMTSPFLLVMAALITLALAPAVVRASPSLPQGFMPLTRGKVSIGASAPAAVSVLRADAAPLPSGFLALERTALRPLAPSRNPITTGFVRQIDRKSRTLESTDEPSSALDVVHTAERDVGAGVDVHDVVRRAGAAIRHDWPLPISAAQEITSGYGIRRDPFTHEHRFHDGVDIAAPSGTAVLTSADGVVEMVATGKDYGKFVTIRHRDGSKSVYGHLRAQSVHEDQRVKQGQKIGEVGSSGRSTGPHLHYELEKNGRSTNPISALTPPARRVAGLAKR